VLLRGSPRHRRVGVAGAALAALSFLTILAFLTTIGPAGAGTGLYTDRNDSLSRLDISRVGHGHKLSRAGEPRLTHRITTHDAWRAMLVDGRPSSIAFFITTDRDSRLERRIVVATTRGEIRARMINHSGDIVGRPSVWKPNRRTITVAFGRRTLGPRLRSYRWYATTTFHRSSSESCGDAGNVTIVCWDRAPNSGYIEHSL
jgi:hypothetical protein